MSVVDKITWAIGWGLTHPQQTFIIAVGIRFAPIPLARAAYATGTILGPPTLQLTRTLAVIAFEESAIIRAATTGVTTGTYLAAGAALGYGIGAVAGTALISQAEKRELVYKGATADVLSFYTGGTEAFDTGAKAPHYWDPQPEAGRPTPGYFNIGGNAQFIATEYKKKFWDALGGRWY